MTGIRLNAIVDICAFVAFLPSFVSGMVLLILLPSGGFQGGRNVLYDTAVFGLVRGEWVTLHNVSSMVFSLLIIVHVLLHWRYFKNIPRYFRSRDQERRESDSSGDIPRR